MFIIRKSDAESEGRALKTPIVTVSVTKENISEVFITTAKQIEKELYQND